MKFSFAPAAGEKSRSRSRSFVFLGRFLILLVVFYFALASHPGNDQIVVPFTAFIARVSGTILSWIGEPITVVGTEIRSQAFSVDIENGCNGVETALLLGSAILAFPASWKRRLLGLAAGFAAIELLNLVRVVSLFWVGAHHPRLFSAAHTVIWQSIVVLWGVVLFLIWANPPSKRADASAQ